MSKNLKLVFHVEDEERNIIVEKQQIILSITHEMMEKAEHLLPVENFPSTLEGLKEWDKVNKPWRDIMDLFDAGIIVMKRFVRKAVIAWIKKQRVPAEG